jgi:hypothetical protein
MEFLLRVPHSSPVEFRLIRTHSTLVEFRLRVSCYIPSDKFKDFGTKISPSTTATPRAISYRRRRRDVFELRDT